MSNEENKEVKLTKAERAKLLEKYELIALKKAPHNISDQKLKEFVEANAEKISTNDQTNPQPAQTPEAGQNPEAGKEGANPDQTKPEDQIDADRKLQLDLFVKLNGVEANPDLTTDELISINSAKQEENEAKKTYFNLFGKNALDGMTLDQIRSANENEQKRIDEISKQQEKAKTAQKSTNGLQYDPKVEALIKNEKTGEKMIVNRATLPFLNREEWIEQIETPKELK